MKLAISTRVDQDYITVKNGFNIDLFKKLSPPFPPVQLLRFDGSEKNDVVSMKIGFLFFTQMWTSKIVEAKATSNEFKFVDEGVELPFFLKSWRHTHRVTKMATGSMIRDQIEYTAPFGLLSIVLYPFLYLQFAYRIPVYKKIFSKNLH